jgi:ribosome biogenesis GTPase
MKNDYGITNYKKWCQKETIGIIGRIIEVHSQLYTVATVQGVYKSVGLSGRFNQKLATMERSLTIGDFILLSEKADAKLIVGLLPEFNKISKKVSGKKTKEQILATNIEHVFITIACDQHFSIGLLERYLYSFSSNQFNVNIIITKVDLRKQFSFIHSLIKATYPELELIPLSIYEPERLQLLYEKICPGSTSVFIGSSGSGKSTLINALLEEEVQKTKAVNKKHAKGKHTTTNSIILPMKTKIGGYLIDTPGIKSIAVWNDSEATIFSDIESLETRCKFSDCSHSFDQRGCAIQSALKLGVLDEARFKRYLSLKRELARKEKSYQERKKRNNSLKSRQELRRHRK